MILISHRGNINGRIPESENDPLYVMRAIQQGFDVEIDVWYHQHEFYLGHDEPKYRMPDLDFFKDKRMWCHAKNIEALDMMLINNIHCFWHQEDDVTLTSKGHMWTYPGKTLTKNSICVLPEKNNEIPKKCLGICSDYIVNYKENL
jgi:hypothetical protein